MAPTNTGWINSIKHVKPNEPVSAGVTSRPTTQLEANQRYLRERQDAAEIGQGLFLREATVAADAVEGDAVFWSEASQRFEKALAAVEIDSESNTLVPSASSDVVGMLHTKHNATLGDVALFGVFDMPDSFLLNAFGTMMPTPGRYYLSAATAGDIVRQRPPVSVAVCFVMGGGQIMIYPQMRDFIEDHVHYRFSLACTPAGTVDGVSALSSGRHEITDPDASIRGWLPANHSSFAGKAPVGAAFGYNLAEHEQLSNVFPPIPIAAAAVLWDKGESHIGATEVPLGREGLVVIDANGIWWMSDCYGDVPWVKTLVNIPSSLSSSSSSSATVESSSSTAECPRVETMRLDLAFVRMVFATDKSVVTSLETAEGSAIAITNCAGEPATTGCLRIALALEFLIDPDEKFGAQVFKQLTSEGKFGVGYVTEGLIAGSNVTLSGTVQRYLTPGDDSTAVVHQGIVTLDVDVGSADREVFPQVTKLGDTVERAVFDLPCLGFPKAKTSSLRMRFNVPPLGLPSTPKMKFRITLFGTATGTLPSLSLTYRRLVRPDGFATPTPLPTIDVPLSFVSAVGVTANQAIELESGQFTIAAGDTIYAELSRAVDGYAGEVDIVRISGVIFAGS